MYEFKYHRPETVRQAANLLVKNEDAKLVAGGHTLIPVMKQRLASPPHLVDLSHIEGLDAIEMKGRALAIGATAKHADVANSAIVGEAIPALAELAGMIGDPAVRHKGTIGGSLANNDPTADYPAAVSGAGRDHRHQQAPPQGGRVLPGAVHDRAGERRDHHQGDVPAAEEGGLCQIPQPGFALRAGRRVRRQASLGRARRRHRRGRKRRVPRHLVRGSVEEAVFAQGARWHDACRPKA